MEVILKADCSIHLCERIESYTNILPISVRIECKYYLGVKMKIEKKNGFEHSGQYYREQNGYSTKNWYTPYEIPGIQ